MQRSASGRSGEERIGYGDRTKEEFTLSTTDASTPAESLALTTFSQLSKAASQVRRNVYSGLTDTRLTESQLGVLELLLKQGPLSQKEIAKNLMVTGGNITMVVDNLQKRNLVTRTRWQEDRRVVHVKLTELGSETIEAYFPQHLKKVTRAFGELTAEEQNQLSSLCLKLRKSLQSN